MDFNKLDEDWRFANAEVMGGFAELFKRVTNLEQQVANQAVGLQKLGSLNVSLQQDVALKSQAVQQQARASKNQEDARSQYVPLRSDTKPLIDLAAFARRLLNPDDLGHAVTKEVRDAARRALGMPEVREYDL
jgi:hypothetical protein